MQPQDLSLSMGMTLGGDGSSASSNFLILLENGTGEILLEDGINFIELQSGP